MIEGFFVLHMFSKSDITSLAYPASKETIDKYNALENDAKDRVDAITTLPHGTIFWPKGDSRLICEKYFGSENAHRNFCDAVAKEMLRAEIKYKWSGMSEELRKSCVAYMHENGMHYATLDDEWFMRKDITLKQMRQFHAAVFKEHVFPVRALEKTIDAYNALSKDGKARVDGYFVVCKTHMADDGTLLGKEFASIQGCEAFVNLVEREKLRSWIRKRWNALPCSAIDGLMSRLEAARSSGCHFDARNSDKQCLESLWFECKHISHKDMQTYCDFVFDCKVDPYVERVTTLFHGLAALAERFSPEKVGAVACGISDSAAPEGGGGVTHYLRHFVSVAVKTQLTNAQLDRLEALVALKQDDPHVLLLQKTTPFVTYSQMVCADAILDIVTIPPFKEDDWICHVSAALCKTTKGDYFVSFMKKM